MKVIYPEDHEKNAVRRLVTALVHDWDALPKKLQDKLIRTASLAFDPDLSSTSEHKLRVFIHDRQARAAERPAHPNRQKSGASPITSEGTRTIPHARLHWLHDLGAPTKPGDYMVPSLNGELVRVKRQDVDVAVSCQGRCWFTATRHASIDGAPKWMLAAYELEEDT